MFEAMERGELRTLYVIGENPAQSEADVQRARRLIDGLDHLVVQDIVLTKTAEMADVVLPAAAAWAETEGTVSLGDRSPADRGRRLCPSSVRHRSSSRWRTSRPRSRGRARRA